MVRPTRIVLEEDVACEVHRLLSGQETRLTELVDAAKAIQEGGSIEWAVPVTPKTVHRLGGLSLFAKSIGVSVRFEPAVGLDEREAAFHDDFLTRGQVVTANLELARHAFRVLSNAGSLVAEPVGLRSSGFERALLIGQYGGEHVGDLAILGGVLLRLHREYGTSHAHLVSWRPDHTRRLAHGLDSPVSVTVTASDDREVEVLLNRVDALVFAGGPIMDLPRVLARQMATATSARRKGLPIIIDRVGVGPFKRTASRWAARRIVRMASHLSVRTAASAADPVVTGVRADVLQDPAFEYLGARDELSRLKPDESRGIRALLHGSDGRSRIGINLRPIRHLWSPRGVAYSSRVEEQFLDRLAAGLIDHAGRSERAPCYVFFPMNPMELGHSDLRAAYQLHRRVGAKVDLRVWEADPDVDGVVHLLRQMDAVVAMRFHACIFSLTQDLPTLGIDYYPGQGGKVEQLFGDAGRPEDVSRMESFSADWFVTSLSRHADQIASRMHERGQASG
jgi:polysaccharide pyruvyl transferase WcaK-like protein